MVYIMRYIARPAELAQRLVTILRPSPCLCGAGIKMAGMGAGIKMAGMDSGYSSMRELVDNIFPVVSRRGDTGGVSRPFPSRNRSILTEIYLCHACWYHAIEDGNAPSTPGRRRWRARDGRAAH
jgi:hypothetical protein